MGTNYYAVRNAVGHVEPGLDRLHIGKSAIGWPFQFHAIEHLGVHDWPTWRRYLLRPGIRIVSEYRDQEITLEGLENHVIGARQHWESPRVWEATTAGHVVMTLDGDLASDGDFR